MKENLQEISNISHKPYSKTSKKPKD